MKVILSGRRQIGSFPLLCAGKKKSLYCRPNRSSSDDNFDDGQSDDDDDDDDISDNGSNYSDEESSSSDDNDDDGHIVDYDVSDEGSIFSDDDDDDDQSDADAGTGVEMLISSNAAENQRRIIQMVKQLIKSNEFVFTTSTMKPTRSRTRAPNVKINVNRKIAHDLKTSPCLQYLTKGTGVIFLFNKSVVYVCVCI
jgi:hypothetical protein